MILKNSKGYDIIISDTFSELDLQFRLAKKLENKGIKCSQNCSVSISKVKDEGKIEYWKEEKIKKQTSKKMYLDILAVGKGKALIIEMKKNNNPSKKERGYIGAQIEKYQEIGIPVKLCSCEEDFKEILNFFK